MKKKIVFLLLIEVITVFSQLLIVNSQGGFGVGLQIVPPPIINVGLINNSGFQSGNFFIPYNLSHSHNVDNCSFAINYKINLTNKSVELNEPLDFHFNNLALGSYNFTINCTDAFGITTTQTYTFSVNNFKGFNGTTTNISNINIKNITNFVVESTDTGRINFSDYIDLSHGFDLDKYINISSNLIVLNSTFLTSLNKSATLYIYNLTFTNPRILIDGVACPESICKKVSYSGGTLVFNVSHFTAYSSEESPSEGGGSGSTGGGGGGGGGGSSGGGGGGAPAVPIVTDFTVDKTTLKVVLKQGQTKEELLSIKNTGTSIFDVKAYLSAIEKFKVSPEGNEITNTLNPNEEKIMKIVFKAAENQKPDIYTGKILLKGPSIEKEVNALIEVDSAEPLFDVDIEVLPDSKKIFPGEELSLEANLFNVRGFGRVDVVVEYSIKDFNGNVLATEHETLAVETQAKFVRRILVPSDLRPGTYAVFAKVIYADSIGISSDLFEVKAKTITLYPIPIKDYKVLLLLAGVIIAGIVIFSAYRFSHPKKKIVKTKVDEVKELRSEEKLQKLEKELEALESAYKSGFISDESYQKGKKRIEQKLSRLK